MQIVLLSVTIDRVAIPNYEIHMATSMEIPVLEV